MSQAQVLRQDDTWIIMDPQLLAEPAAAMFAPAYWEGRILGRAQGRGDALFLQPDDTRTQWVLRHYRRGGLPGRLIEDRYCYTGLERSRPFHEWRQLAAALQAGVPVPQPVAAAVHRQGAWYRGDIIMQRIADASSLADLLAAGEMQPAWWGVLAEAIARCHRAGYWHADLNARNVICRDGQWWLIDFDRARLRSPGRWREQNIARLRRSLDKLSAAGELCFSEDDWQYFLRAYRKQVD